MDNKVSSLGQGPGLAWKRGSSSFPPGSLASLQEWTGGTTEPVEPPWHGEVDFQQWNTIGWAITDDGILCIKPWEGDTGETGSAITDDDVPWNDKRLKIKKIESTGLIMLNEDSAWLFSICSSLTDLTALAEWDVSNVKNMYNMFWHCSSLTDLTALENWSVSNVTDMAYMFSSCSSLTDLTPLANWKVSNVMDMSSMFEYCSSLTDLTALQNWNVSSVTSMDSMFQGCSSLQRIGIPSIANGGQKLVENAEAAKLTTVLPSIISDDGSMGPYTWDELYTEMTTNPDYFEYETVWVKAEEEE